MVLIIPIWLGLLAFLCCWYAMRWSKFAVCLQTLEEPRLRLMQRPVSFSLVVSLLSLLSASVGRSPLLPLFLSLSLSLFVAQTHRPTLKWIFYWNAIGSDRMR